MILLAPRHVGDLCQKHSRASLEARALGDDPFLAPPSASYHASRCRVRVRGQSVECCAYAGVPLVYDACNWRTPSRLEGVDGGVASSSLGGSAAHSDV